MSNIAIYCGWLSDNVAGPFTRPEVEFMPGAFAYHLYSFSAQSVRTADRFWVGPLLAKGATITLGNVYEPVLGGTPDIPIFLSRLIYHGFTFGESAYASLGFVSWQTTVVGDPLYRPFGRSPEMLHAQLYLQRSPLVEWSHLRRINMNLANGVALQTAATRLEQIPITKSSPVLLEKLADLYAALGKPTSATETWQKALDFGPSPQQRVRLRLEIARKLEDLGRPQDEYNDLKALVEEIPDYPAKDAIYRRLIALAEDLKHPDDVQGWTLLLNRPKTAPE
jgi:tetratricopeptide (TPR) repeat protein